MKNKIKRITIYSIILGLTLALVMSTIHYRNSLDYIFSKSDVEYNDVIHVKKLGNELAFFYIKKFQYGIEGLGLLSVSKEEIGWKREDNSASSMPSDFLIQIKFYKNYLGQESVLYYGIIYNLKVKKIETIRNESEHNYAQIVSVDGYRLWFYEGTHGKYNFKGYDEKGKVIK